jgi:hypothetical protein
LWSTPDPMILRLKIESPQAFGPPPPKPQFGGVCQQPEKLRKA